MSGSSSAAGKGRQRSPNRQQQRGGTGSGEGGAAPTSQDRPEAEAHERWSRSIRARSKADNDERMVVKTEGERSAPVSQGGQSGRVGDTGSSSNVVIKQEYKGGRSKAEAGARGEQSSRREAGAPGAASASHDHFEADGGKGAARSLPTCPKKAVSRMRESRKGDSSGKAPAGNSQAGGGNSNPKEGQADDAGVPDVVWLRQVLDKPGLAHINPSASASDNVARSEKCLKTFLAAQEMCGGGQLAASGLGEARALIEAAQKLAEQQLDRQSAGLRSNTRKQDSAERAALVIKNHNAAIQAALSSPACDNAPSIESLCHLHGLLCADGLCMMHPHLSAFNLGPALLSTPLHTRQKKLQTRNVKL